MIKNNLLIIAFLQFTLVSLVFSQVKQEEPSLMPDSTTIDGWRHVGVAERYKNDELFYLINGGADLYQECGFVEVVAQSFQNTDNEKISVEIYEMESDSSALSIFTLSATKNAEKVELGQMALSTANSLIIWKGKCFIMLRSSSVSESVKMGSYTIAEYLVKNIQTEGVLPYFVSQIIENNNVESYKYFHGTLGLATAYYFSGSNIFNISQGLSFTSENGKHIHLIYKNKELAKSTFISAIEAMEKASKFTLKDKTETQVSFTDRKQKPIAVALKESEIVIKIKE